MPWRTLELSESWPMGNNTLYVTTIAMFAPEKMSESLGHGEHPENNRVSTHSTRLGEPTAAVFGLA